MARKTGLSENEVRIIITFYWKDVESKVRSFEHSSIFIRNIGTFSLEYNLLRKEVKIMIARIRNGSEFAKVYLTRLLKNRSKFSKQHYEIWRRRITKCN